MRKVMGERGCGKGEKEEEKGRKRQKNKMKGEKIIPE
jgi:hypothetical protein